MCTLNQGKRFHYRRAVMARVGQSTGCRLVTRLGLWNHWIKYTLHQLQHTATYPEPAASTRDPSG
jgi:hypothetical protein